MDKDLLLRLIEQIGINSHNDKQEILLETHEEIKNYKHIRRFFRLEFLIYNNIIEDLEKQLYFSKIMGINLIAIKEDDIPSQFLNIESTNLEFNDNLFMEFNMHKGTYYGGSNDNNILNIKTVILRNSQFQTLEESKSLLDFVRSNIMFFGDPDNSKIEVLKNFKNNNEKYIDNLYLKTTNSYYISITEDFN